MLFFCFPYMFREKVWKISSDIKRLYKRIGVAGIIIPFCCGMHPTGVVVVWKYSSLTCTASQFAIAKLWSSQQWRNIVVVVYWKNFSCRQPHFTATYCISKLYWVSRVEAILRIVFLKRCLLSRPYIYSVYHERCNRWNVKNSTQLRVMFFVELK